MRAARRDVPAHRAMTGRRLRVLVIEDSPNDAELIVEQLASGGFEGVHERVQTAAALKAAVAHSPWGIGVSDYSMPSFTGPEALGVVPALGFGGPFVMGVCPSGRGTGRAR